MDHQRFISKYIKDSHITFRNHIFPNKPSDTNFNLDSKTQVVLIAQLSPLILSSNSSNDPIIHFIFFENMLIFLYMLIISYSELVDNVWSEIFKKEAVFQDTQEEKLVKNIVASQKITIKKYLLFHTFFPYYVSGFGFHCYISINTNNFWDRIT